LIIEPADIDHGIVFERVDLDPPVRIPAEVAHSIDRPRRSALGKGDIVIETVEHCLSALAGVGVDNALLKVDAMEVPLGDGSAEPFLQAIEAVGLRVQEAPRATIKITAPLVFEEGAAMIAAFPSTTPGLHIVYELDYGTSSNRIQKQAFGFHLTPEAYRLEVAPARTYSLSEEAEALQSSGMCTHLSPSEVLVIGPDGPIDNAWRFEDEPVRHKVLDIIGDLSLAGAPIDGRIVASRSGHSLNRRMATALREQAQQVVSPSAEQRAATMDIRTIQKIMPHRYPMLLVDRVIELEGDERAVGVKNVTINEPFFAGHYPRTPIMPGVLIVEAMAQLGGLLLSQRLETTGKIAVLLSLDKVKLRHPVTPGDQLLLEARTVRASSRMASLECKASVAGKPAAEASIRFMMVDAEQGLS
jgi:UDP-3-O-[3-hydroxymyristoyl] N-acetylglucosamine deacetylase/3-hydroxyacyl-[acyl-carrier-protein] dehydratase